MKLKIKILISFILIIIVPIIVSKFASDFIDSQTAKSINKHYGITTVVKSDVDDNIRLMSKISASIYDVVARDVVNLYSEHDYSNEQYWESLKDYIDKSNMHIVVYRGENISYANCNEATKAYYKKVLPKKSVQTYVDDEIRYYYDKDSTLIIRNLWYYDSDEGDSAIYFIMNSENALSECEDFHRIKCITIALIIILAIVVFIFWLKRQLFEPLEYLETATENIMEGSFDYSLEGLDNGLLSRAVKNFEKMRVAMKSSSEHRMKSDKESRELISNISHDLKTPLTTIKGYAEALKENVVQDPEKQHKYFQTIYNKANDMNKLIDELTIYSKIDTDSIPYVFARVNIVEWFEDLGRELKMELEAKDIEFTFNNYGRYEEYCVVDTEQLRRVINNIINNSVKNIVNKYGKINMRLRDEGEFVQVEIEDNGRGISMKDLPLIFNRFYRGDSSRNTAQGGSGIGLAIVKKIIEEHGGKVWARSVEGKGTTMIFVLKKNKEEYIR